jgi:hypothetical protein
LKITKIFFIGEMTDEKTVAYLKAFHNLAFNIVKEDNWNDYLEMTKELGYIPEEYRVQTCGYCKSSRIEHTCEVCDVSFCESCIFVCQKCAVILCINCTTNSCCVEYAKNCRNFGSQLCNCVELCGDCKKDPLKYMCVNCEASGEHLKGCIYKNTEKPQKTRCSFCSACMNPATRVPTGVDYSDSE